MFAPQTWFTRLTPEERQSAQALDLALTRFSEALHGPEGPDVDQLSLLGKEIHDRARRLLDGETTWCRQDRERLETLCEAVQPVT